MARIERVEGMLREWGEWVRSAGECDKGDGFPSRNCLDPDWGRPGQGMRPDFKVVLPGRGGMTHFVVSSLSRTLQETLVRHYCLNQPVAEIAAAMQSAAATVDQRIWRAHAALAHTL